MVVTVEFLKLTMTNGKTSIECIIQLGQIFKSIMHNTVTARYSGVYYIIQLRIQKQEENYAQSWEYLTRPLLCISVFFKTASDVLYNIYCKILMQNIYCKWCVIQLLINNVQASVLFYCSLLDPCFAILTVMTCGTQHHAFQKRHF